MAEQQDDNEKQSKQPTTSNQYGKGLVKDMIDLASPAGSYSYAKNATIVLPDGQQGFAIHTEPGNIRQTQFPYTLIGSVLLTEDQWIVFTTNNTVSEIGLYVEGTGSYSTQMNDAATIAAGLPGLGFKTTNLITGASRRNFDCGFDVYWADVLNPNRMWDSAFLYPNPWVQDCVTLASCITCTNTNLIDVEQLRLSPQFSVPCLTLAKSPGSGTLPNGSYQVCIRYAINGIPCTDFIALSNIQSTFTHNNNGGAITVTISGISSETTIIFPEIEVIVISMSNFQVQAKRLGIYSSSQQVIAIDNLNPTLENIPLNIIPISNPIIEKSDAIYAVSNYLLQVGTYEKPEFNYQPLANQIIANWTAIQYPDDYYHKGGLNGFPMNVSHLMDEVYAYYIRWDYTTGDKSASYHIPGLPAGTGATLSIGGPSTGDGGVTLCSGRFVGYSSTELYPNDEPSIWGSLCGLPIRHHKFPNQATFGGTILSHFNAFGSTNTITVMGVYFTNIQPPIDINGIVIPNIQGYEILRATRDGNKSVIAKGMFNHMRGYTKSDNTLGLYQNYGYDDLNPDIYLTSSQTIGTVGGVDNNDPTRGNTLDTVYYDITSFHSPDTSFQHPYLGTGSISLYMALAGTSTGSFHQSYKHPKFRVLTNLAGELSALITAMEVVSQIMSIISGSGTNLQLAATNKIPLTIPFGFSAIAEGSLGVTSDIIYAAGLITAGILETLMIPLEIIVIEAQILNIVQGLVPEIQYAWQYDSHGFYNKPIPTGQFDESVFNYEYVKGHLQSFSDISGNSYDVNNLYRNNYVLMNIGGLPVFPAPYNTAPFADASRFTLGQVGAAPGVIDGFGRVFTGTASSTIIGPYNSPIVSWYGAYKIPQPAQYGQVDSPKQVPVSCMQTWSNSVMSTGVLFGGDIYINRYTEKNQMMFFNDWLVDTTPDFPYDYTTVENIPYPRFWINNTKVYYDLWEQAQANWHVDEPDIGTTVFGLGLSFYLKNGYFYLFNNGVRDFYVESEVNVGFRDWEDVAEKRFYDPYGYTSLDYMFRSDIIKSDTLYKYDYSLSAGRFWNQYLSWSKCLDRDYNPILAYTCYNYYPRRVYNSLPQEEEQRKDNWKVFLPNNYKDFPTKVVTVKDINKTGALFLLYDQAPQSFVGIETISTKSGTEYTIGNGALFNQPLQSVTNVDDSYQYGSCQNRLSVISTPYGVLWVSQVTGKILHYAPSKRYYNQGEDMVDITAQGMKHWSSLYLPSRLLEQYPSYPLYDNPVAGIGIQMMYDAINEIIYICKKDYVALDPVHTHLNGSRFSYRNVHLDRDIPIQLTDTQYFTNCSWTLSYDPKQKKFISFHDWFPALNIPAKTHFLTTNIDDGTNIGDIMWRHNSQAQSFCNYYNIDYNFELQYPIITGATMTTLQNISVVIESYLYQANNVDKFLNFDQFFDQAIVNNREQNSGLLQLNLRKYDDPYSVAQYPFIDAQGTQILYSRVENTWKINSFYDMTNDRSEFNLGNQQMFTTSPNGVDFSINLPYIDLNKPFFQKKRFRARNNFIFLRKIAPGQNSMSVLFSSTKNQISPR